MRIPIPSFRVQIVLLVLFLVMNSALFLRNYFLDSFQSYSDQVDALKIDEKVNQVYQKYQGKLDQQSSAEFKADIEAILVTESQKTLAQRLFKNEIQLYSTFIYIFITIFALLLFFIGFYLITKPLQRLQTATVQLAKGDLSIEVRESRFSPLNDLILSFNTMTKELNSSRDRLIQAEKESAWRDMARVLAHEIKNPLTPIRLSIERLEDKYDSGSKDFDQVFNNVKKIIHEEVNNLQTLAGEFSQFARLPVAQPVKYSIHDQLQEIIKPYQDKAEFVLKINAETNHISADVNQMKQVFANLIQNSIQSLGTDDRLIEIETSSKSNDIQVVIKDHGQGIDPEDLEKIFDPYFSRREKGTGLGLAIVKRIIEQHNGTITAASRPRAGATFTLTFPKLNNQTQDINIT
jgi:nitrogen fixation/metabolism regulation signal transduction histidine kinase